LSRVCLPLGEIIPLGRDKLNLSKLDQIAAVLNEIKPDIIINAAAYTAVDIAEKEPDIAMRINAHAPAEIARYAKENDVLLVHYSTDYIFDGQNTVAYSENHKPNPVNVYGKSKLKGETLIVDSGAKYIIFRTSWVFSSRGNNFLLTMLRLMRERREIDVINDQFGTPTWARLIAEVTGLVISKIIPQLMNESFESGIYHVASSGKTSWNGYAKTILQLANNSIASNKITCDVNEISTLDYPVKTARPLDTALSVSKLEGGFSLSMPNWKDCLRLCIDEMDLNKK